MTSPEAESVMLTVVLMLYKDQAKHYDHTGLRSLCNVEQTVKLSLISSISAITAFI